jgi:hypothetical protein
MVCYDADTLDTKKQKVVQFIQGVIMLVLGRPNNTIVESGCCKMAKIANKVSKSCSLSSNIRN